MGMGKADSEGCVEAHGRRLWNVSGLHTLPHLGLQRATVDCVGQRGGVQTWPGNACPKPWLEPKTKSEP